VARKSFIEENQKHSHHRQRRKNQTMVSTSAKLMIFLGLPTIAGFIGLYAAFLSQYKDPEKKLAIEADFGLPFMLTLMLVVVIGFQTNGYASSEVKPLVKWPKVKKTRKVIHKHVVKNDDGDDEDDDEKEEDAKKNE